MAKSKNRRSKRYHQIDTDDCEFQGNGTWVKIPQKATVKHFQFVASMIEIYVTNGIKENATKSAEVKTDNTSVKNTSQITTDIIKAKMTGMKKEVDGLDEYNRAYKKWIPELLLKWNWVTDIESEIISIEGNKVRLESYLLDDTALNITNDFLIDNFGEFNVLLGEFPNNCDSYTASFDGNKTITVNEKLRRNYVAGTDYLLLGYPSPKWEKTADLLTHNEIVWLGTKLLNHYNGKMNEAQLKREKKTVVA